MKFTCVKEHLSEALAVAERFTGKNITLPVLGNVLLEGSENWLHVVATNLEHAIQIKVPGKGVRSGRLSVPAKIMAPLIQSLKEERITLEGKGGSLFVKTEQREIRIQGISADDFPLLPTIKKTATFRVDGVLVQSGLEKVLPAVSPSEFKPEFTGVFWAVSGNELRLAATDTFRLAEKKITLSEKSEGPPLTFILPSRVAQELTRVAGEGVIKISVGKNQVIFEFQGIRIYSRLIDGQFPDYSTIIPSRFGISSFVPRVEFRDAVRSASIFASKLYEVTLTLQESTLELRTQNPESGEYHTSLSVQSSSTGTGSTTLNFNYRYLLDGLNVLDEDELFFGCNQENLPSLLRNRSEESFRYVLMPIRLG